tara:strand:- start:203 stop:865 length:663 start_codon:yes stop_codon:yes gene_type:complete
MNEQVDFYTPSGLHVYFKDKLENYDIDIENVVNSVEEKVPNHLLSHVEMIVVGWFPEFEERNINAFYKDAILHVSNEQDDVDDMVDDIIHEVAHALEENYGYEIYGDSKIKNEFLKKRERLHQELWSIGHKIPESVFRDVEYNQELDNFLFKTVGYDKLGIICTGLFINPYAPTSLREYFATGFTDFYMSEDYSTLKTISPQLYNKIIMLHEQNFLDNPY